MNFWKQITHVMKFFRSEEDPKAKLPQNFISGFLEVRHNKVFYGTAVDCTDIVQGRN